MNKPEQCFRCGSEGTLVYEESHESFDHDTYEPEFYKGYTCTECGCFHEEEGKVIEYLCDKELHTNYNVKSWLN